MSAYLSPIGNEPQIDANGDPLSGGKLYTYIAGTSTPAATYTNSTAGTPQANPVILNSRGSPASPIWLQGGQAYKLVLKDANDVALAPDFDNVTGINDPAATATFDQWVLYSGTPTYISATSFSVAGDQTNTFQIGRRVKTSNGGGTVYSTITASVYGALTTITVVNDSSVLDAGLSQVSYGLLSVTNPAVPAVATLNSKPAQASTSGTSIDFTSIPSWVKRITITWAGVSTNGASNPLIQIGKSAGVETSGYLGASYGVTSGVAAAISNYTTGFGVNLAPGANLAHGVIEIVLMDAATNLWACSGTLSLSNGPNMLGLAGTKALSGTLDRVRITTVGGADTFDAGTIGLLYE